MVGVGLNVNQTMFEGTYRANPTSMKLETNNEFNIVELKEELFKFIEKHIKQKDFEKNTLNFYNKHDYLLGKKVKEGIVEGINSDFEIIINGKAISTGELTEIK